MHLDPHSQMASLKSGKRRSRYVYRDDGSVRGIDADTARAFLSQPNGMLTFWCTLLQINPELIITVYTRTIQQPVPDAAEFRCPQCGEDRQIEQVITVTNIRYFCAVCAHHWSRQ
jgi:predicted RNA-binding Zn-ribbon protein involved in translation (DUF1610 family)